MTTRARFILVLAALGSAVGCIPMTPVPSPYTPIYTYDAPSSTAGHGIAIALVNPSLSEATKSAVVMAYAQQGQMAPPDLMNADPAFRSFHQALSTSLLQYFTASGFTVSGPFKSADAMTFPEKKQADLLLTIEFNTLIQQPTPGVTDTLVMSSGMCTYGGTIDLVMWEPLSMQRMWAKSVTVEQMETDCSFTTRNIEDYNLLMRNAYNSLYERAFPAVMRTAERYFAAEEIALVKRQSEEIRASKVY